MSLDLIPYGLPLRSPMATSHAIVADRRGALVRLDDHGTIGWGDLCPMPGWSVQEFESLHDQVDMAGLRLDEDMIGDVLDTLVGAPEARAALAGAAADVLAQEAGLSLAAHLAPEPLERADESWSDVAAPSSSDTGRVRIVGYSIPSCSRYVSYCDAS